MRPLLILACCALALIPSPPAGAQQRHDDGHRGSWGDHGGRGDHGDWRGGYQRGYSQATRQAQRQYYRDRRPGYTYSPGYGWYNPNEVIGGAIGGWLWRQFAQPEPEPPPVVVVQQPPAPIRTVGWCLDRYKSYDVESRTYLGYDGYRHSCP